MHLDHAFAAEYKSRYCCSLASIIFRWPEALKTYVKQKQKNPSRVLIFIEKSACAVLSTVFPPRYLSIDISFCLLASRFFFFFVNVRTMYLLSFFFSFFFFPAHLKFSLASLDNYEV